MPRLQGTIAVGLKLAGQVERARATAGRVDGFAVDVDAIPDLDAFEPRSAADFDIAWGAALASGDFRYAAKVLARYAEVANADDNALVVMNLLEARVKNADLQPFVEKYGEAKTRDLLVVASALWSLATNAQQHEFVRKGLHQGQRRQAGGQGAGGAAVTAIRGRRRC